MMAYVTAQVNSKKRLKPTDIIKFAWEKQKETANTKSKPVKPLTISDVEQIKAMALQREKELKEKGII